MRRRWKIALPLVMGPLALVSCDLFKTRDPESPSQVSSNYLPPSTPSILFDNLVNAFRDLSDVNYMRSLADSSGGQAGFTFTPTSQAAGVYGVFAAWNRQYEQQYFLNLRASLQPGTVTSLVFTNESIQSSSPDSQQVEKTYQLNIPHTRNDLAKSVSGKMQVVVARDSRSGFWFILRWTDIALNPSDATWSDAKGVFGQ